MTRPGCPDPEALAALAVGGDLAARSELADHVLTCAECRADFRLLARMHRTAQEIEHAPRRAWLPPLAAAAAAFALGLLLGRTGPFPRPVPPAATPTAAASAPAADERAGEVADLRSRLEAARAPAVNVPIVDLEPDRSRGAGGAEADVRMPAEGWVTAVLAVSGGAAEGDHALEIRDASGRVVWRGEGLQRNDYGTFTVALPSHLLPPGRYELRLSRPAGDGAARLVQAYRISVRAAEPGAGSPRRSASPWPPRTRRQRTRSRPRASSRPRRSKPRSRAASPTSTFSRRWPANSSA